jgi:hypothetical protein
MFSEGSVRIGIIILALACVSSAQTAKRITGKYSNPALGYEITIPEGLAGTTGDQAGPERGFNLSLPSGGTISVFGEPNSLEWRAPIDGIRHALGVEKCDPVTQKATGFMRMGRLTGTTGTLLCGDRYVEMLLAFHPRGGPIYWITLHTTAQKRVEDVTAFNKLAATFQLISPQ